MRHKLLSLLIFISGVISAQKPDTNVVSFYFVVQNPKYYGNEARCWFEISGIKDSMIQNRINDTLRNSFNENFRATAAPPIKPVLQLPDLNKKGYTDYKFPGDWTYSGSVRLCDADSVCYLKQDACRNGYGTKIYRYHFAIASGKMATIVIDTAVYRNGIQLTFNLNNGHLMPNQYAVQVIPERKDALKDMLYAMASSELSNNTSPEYRYARINRDSGSNPLDSIRFTSEMLILIMNGGGNGYYEPKLIWNSYALKPTPTSNFKGTAILTVGLWLDASIQFFDQEEWNSLLKIYERY